MYVLLEANYPNAALSSV